MMKRTSKSIVIFGLLVLLFSAPIGLADSVNDEQLHREMYKTVYGHYPSASWSCDRTQAGLPDPPIPEVPTDVRYFIDSDLIEVPTDSLSIQIETSCNVLKIFSTKTTLKDRLLAGFPRLLNQVSTCANAYKLPNLNDAQFILSRLRIQCYKGGYESNQLASARPRPGHDHDYEMRIDTQSAGILQEDYFHEIGWSDSILSSTIFHEALHFSANNNKVWHEKGEATRQSDQEFFSDRVYLTEALCFPDTPTGLRLRSFAHEVPEKLHESCLAAWIQVDPNVSPPKAKPIKRDEVESICRRVEQGMTVFAENTEKNKRKPVPSAPLISEQSYLKLLNPTPPKSVH